MASFYNLNPKEAFEKLRSGISGEVEPLRQLGILLDEETVKQVAYTTGVARMGQELTQQQKVHARYAAILQQTSLAQGDMARTLDSPANQLRILRDEVKQIGIEFGMVLLPTIKEFLQSGREVAGWFNKLPEGTKESVLALGKFGAEVATVNTGMTAMSWALGLPLPPWAKLAAAIALAAKELDDYIQKQNKVNSYNKDAEVRKNPLTGALEKKVLTENLTLLEKLTKAKNDYGFGLPNNTLMLQGPGKYAWMGLNDDELAAHQQYEIDKANEEARKKQEEENKRLEAERQRQSAQEKAVAMEKAKIAEDLRNKLYEYSHTELETELHKIDLEVKEHKKKYTEIVGLDEWAEQAKSEIRKKYAKEWEDFATSVTESELQARLRAIEREKEAWIKKVGDELRATQLAEQQKRKAIQDAAKQALQENKDLLKKIAQINKMEANKQVDGQWVVDPEATRKMREEAWVRLREQQLELQRKDLGLDFDITAQDVMNFSQMKKEIDENLIPIFDQTGKAAAQQFYAPFADQASKIGNAFTGGVGSAAGSGATNVSVGDIVTHVTINASSPVDVAVLPDQVADQVAGKIEQKLSSVLSQNNLYGYSRGW
jgi:hypothetical protein